MIIHNTKHVYPDWFYRGNIFILDHLHYYTYMNLCEHLDGVRMTSINFRDLLFWSIRSRECYED